MSTILKYDLFFNNGKNTQLNIVYLLLFTILSIIVIPISMKLGQYVFGYEYGSIIGVCILVSLPLIYLQYKAYTDNNKNKNKH